MKKVLLILLALVLVTGCTNINDTSYDDIIKETTESSTKIYNTYRKGYKFYLPHGLYVKTSNDYNETIKGQNETYYLYIDLISYLNKEEIDYEGSDSEYFKSLNDDNMSGYVEIKKHKKGKYLVEIVYNYAKIEVIVDKDNLHNAVARSMVILSSIKYNDSFLNSLSEDSLLNYREETVDLFDKSGRDSTSNFLEYADELDDYNGNENDVPDYDVIN